MIARISGTLFNKSTSCSIIDVHGVGYQVFTPLSSYYALGDPGEEVALLIYTHVSEDTLMLFGFFTEEEKKLFELLISVSKIGPKLALNILSGASVSEFVSAVKKSNLVKLHSIPGIGKKTAERILLELRDKIIKIFRDTAPDIPEKQESERDGMLMDASSALINLGYKRDAADEATKKVKSRITTDITFEELIKASLKELSNARTR